jgi:hypothetical protein
MRLPLLLALVIACKPKYPADTPDTDVAVPPADTDVVDTGDTGSPPGDLDDDGYPDATDDCPEDPQEHLDSDGDGICDGKDACNGDPSQWTDADGDGWCDELDDDCPDNPEGRDDADDDGDCDGDDDSDGDGISNGEELVYGLDCGRSDPYKADSDDDGVLDPADPYPLDPWKEYILWRNESGTIDMALSNRDGTFAEVVTIGTAYGGTTNTTYRYVAFVIADFDGNGATDFLALGDPAISGTPYDLWFFWRKGNATTFDQRKIGTTTKNILGAAADVDNDEAMDLVQFERTPASGTITGGIVRTYLLANTPIGSACVYSTDPANPEGCMFVEKLGVDIGTWVNGQWSVNYARDLVDINNDGHRDFVMGKISSGGNSPVPVAVMTGNGDGTFDAPVDTFSHNSGACGSSPANTLLFSDFDNNGIGDMILGLDDDGDPGSAWFYPGKWTSGVYSVDTSRCAEAFDTNPGIESGSDDPGVGWARNFDFNFDGVQDVMVGFDTGAVWYPPTRTELRLGKGDGTFEAPTLVRTFPTTYAGHQFAIPQQVCPRFPLE